MLRHIGIGLVLLGLLAIPQPSHAQERNGVHDFDWDIGTWKVHQKRLLHPLTGSTSWVEYDGTDVVSRIWDGANQGKIETNGASGSLAIWTLRLYNADENQWNIYFTNKANEGLSQPVTGEFAGNGAAFYDQEPYKGKQIMVRFRVHDITANTCQFDQSFSPDGGKTWEMNLIVNETRST